MSLIDRITQSNPKLRAYAGREPSTEKEKEMLLEELFTDTFTSALETLNGPEGQLMVHPDGPENATVFLNGKAYHLNHQSEQTPGLGNMHDKRSWTLHSKETVSVSDGWFSSKQFPKVSIGLELDVESNEKYSWPKGMISYENRESGTEISFQQKPGRFRRTSSSEKAFKTEWPANEDEFRPVFKMAKNALESLTEVAFSQPRINQKLRPLQL